MSLLTNVLKLWRTGQYLLPADSGFMVKHLFANGEPGFAKLDFSGFAGMYQDRARTVPYTAVEQPLGSFTGLNGVTATAPADVNRGVVSARVNLLTKTENMVPTLIIGTAWTRGAFGNWLIPTNLGPTIAPDGSNNAVAVCSTGTGGVTTLVHRSSVFPSTTYKFTVQVRKVEGEDQTGLTGLRLLFQTGNNGVLVNEIAASVLIGTSVSDVWQQFEISYTTPATGVNQVEVGIWFASAPNAAVAVWGGSLTLSTDAHLPYQRVNTATDYDTVGFPHYLAFDGTNTTYVTPSINFSGTDKMTVWAGVGTDISGAAGYLLNHNFTGGNSFRLGVPAPAGAINSVVVENIPSFASISKSGLAGNLRSVISASHRSGEHLLRLDGVLVSSETNATTGPYGGNSPLYIGVLGTGSSFFNGKIYSLIVRGAATPLPQIEATENLIRKTMRLP